MSEEGVQEVPDYVVRPMLRDEIPQVLELWRRTGLAEGTHSLDTWFDHDPEGFYVAATEDGTVLGACAGVLQHSDLAFIGLYVVATAFQKRGIGRRIWDAVMDRVGERNVGVNPVPDQLDNYRDRANFPIQADWRSVICVSKGLDLSQVGDPDLLPDVGVRLLTPEDEDLVRQVVEYDADVCGFDRGDLIPLVSGQKESATRVATRAEDDSVCGYGNVRLSIKGNAIVGPLYADDSRVAEKLLCELARTSPVAQAEGVLMMTVDSNPEGLEMAERLGFSRTGVIARLYRKADVEIKFEKVFSQHNLNFAVV